MRTASRSKSNKQISKREFIMDTQKTGTANGAEKVGNKPDKIRMEATAFTPSSDTGVTGEERYQLIAEAAYFRAERRSFTPGYELEDWLNAEAEIDIRLKEAGTSDSTKDA